MTMAVVDDESVEMVRAIRERFVEAVAEGVHGGEGADEESWGRATLGIIVAERLS